MVTKFSEIYKILVKEKNITKERKYLNYLIFILILEESNSKHLKIFYENINLKTKSLNPFIVDMNEKEKLDKYARVERNEQVINSSEENVKNPFYKWNSKDNSILEFIDDINKYI